MGGGYRGLATDGLGVIPLSLSRGPASLTLSLDFLDSRGDCSVPKIVKITVKLQRTHSTAPRHIAVKTLRISGLV